MWEGAIYLPWQMLLYLSVGLITIIVVSFFTQPVAKSQLDQFYMCLRTPVLEPEPEVKPFTLPAGVEPWPRHVLFDHPDFEIPRPGRTAVTGFLVICGLIVLLVGCFFWILA